MGLLSAGTVVLAIQHVRGNAAVATSVGGHAALHEANDCIGGAEYPAKLEMKEEERGAGSHPLPSYQAEIQLTHAESAGVAWELILTDDRRQPVQPVQRGTAAAKRGEPPAIGRIRAEDLADGYYMVQARAAIASKDHPSTVLEAARYGRMEGGTWSEMPFPEWHNRSRASIAIAADELAQKEVERNQREVTKLQETERP
jgi:hypothetical protein